MQDFNKTLGAYSQSVFVPNSSLGLTVTSEGLGIVWGLTDTGIVAITILHFVSYRPEFYFQVMFMNLM